MEYNVYVTEILNELTLSFWISVYLVSPIFSGLEIIVQEIITKSIYYITNKVNLTRNKIMGLGFNSINKLQHLQSLHNEYETKKTITEKLKISEDFLDETRGGMFLLNDLGEKVFGNIRLSKSETEDYSDNFYFDRDIISKQEFTIKELQEIKNGISIINIDGKEYYTNESIRVNVCRSEHQFMDSRFKNEIELSFKQVESDFLENIEMYLFQKKVYKKWIVFKVLAFIPLMLFLSELVEVVFGILYDHFFL